MAKNNDLVVTAGLNIDASVKQIQTELNTEVAPKLKLNIACNIDKQSLNVKAMQDSINSVAKNTNLNLNIGKNVTNDVVDAFNDAFNMVGKMGEQTKKEFNAQTKQMLQEFKDAWQKGLSTGDFSLYEESLKKLQDRVRDFSKGDLQTLKNSIEDIRRGFTDGSMVSIGSNLKQWLDRSTGSDAQTREYLDALYGSGKYRISTGHAGFDTLAGEEKANADSILESAKQVLEYQRKIKEVGWGIEELERTGATAEQIAEATEDKLRNIVGLSERIRGDEWIPIDISDDVREVNQLTTAMSNQSDELHREQELLLQRYEALVAKIEKAKLNINEIAVRTESTGETVNYNERFQEIMGGRIIDTDTLKLAKNLFAAINNEYTILNARAESAIPQTALENLIQRVAKTDSQIKVLTLDYEKLNVASDSTSKNLEDAFGKLNAVMEGFDFSADFRGKSKDELTDTVKQYTQIRVALNDAQSLLRAAQKEEAVFNRELNKELKIEEQLNKEKEKQFNKEYNQALKEEQKEIELKEKKLVLTKQLQEEQQHDYWQGRFEESVKGLTAENTELKALKEQLQGYNQALGEAEKQQKRAFQDSNRTANLQNRIKKLTTDVNAYANANERVVKSNKQMSNGKVFSEEYLRIMSQLAKGAELTDREVKDLAADFIILKKQAKSLGLEGSSAIEKFGKSFGIVSTYISANQVINSITNKIREAANELKTVDERLTEISKTSDRTAESLKRLGESSFDTASKYGRTASDYLYGVQEMSRAGFSEAKSEDMAELSILAQAAGDMTSELANEYLIATNAAYQYKGSVDKLNDSLDRQNYVTNHYALSMSDLAEATKIAASQAAQSGIGIDEMTAALSTMISTTQQGGEIAARSLRGILMNIQQVKGEVGDGEEDITTESLSKYEKAAKALGVSLKEVKDGAVTLRDPMVVLDELATAFNKEADNSIKKANLISAIGGKYRGNQLSALLSNWDTYKEILETFNSDQAVGSAMDEAEKSANNWAGSLNKVKNSWTELVNEFLNSENAVTILQAVDKIIQSLSNPDTIEHLTAISNTITNIAEIVGNLYDNFDEELGVLSLLSAFNNTKGLEWFNELYADLKGAKEGIDEVADAEAKLNESAKGFKISGVDANIAESLKDKYDQITVIQEDASEKLSILIDGNLKTQLETAKKIRDEYGDIANRSDEVYQSLNQNISETEALYEQYQSIIEESGKTNQALVDDSLNDDIESVAQTALNSLAEIETETNNLRSDWFETLGDLQKGSLKTIDTMKSALQKVAEGEYLSSDDFWGLAEFDVDNILNGAELVGDKFKVTEEQLISLKDVYVQKQIDSIEAENADLKIKKQQTDELIKQAELEIQALGRRGLSNSAYRTQFEEANEQLRQAKKNSQKYGDNIYRNNLLIKQLNSSLGYTVNLEDVIKQKQEELNAKLKEAQSTADEYAKAMTQAVQNVIDGYETEKETLEDEKDALESQLDILNEKKDSLEYVIDQYKQLASLVKDEVDAEIDALEKQREIEENAIQEKIDALKDSKQQQEETNELLEKELNLQNKLAELERAKSTKVRTYSEERGWHYDVSKEAVVNAQTAVDEAQKSYDEAVANKLYNDQLQELEDQKAAITQNYDALIDASKEYYEQFAEIIEEESKAEQEQLAEQILGSEWREKIKAKDTQILNKFRNDFKSYNTQLNSLVKNEIESLKSSIKAKEDEIKAKNSQIDAWKKYKSQVENTIDTVSSKYDDYMEKLGNLNITEQDSYETRENNLRTFAAQYESLIDEIQGYQNEIDGLTIPVTVDDWDARQEMAKFIDDYREAIESMQKALDESATGYGIVNSAWDARLADAANEMRRGSYANGGVVDYTGIAAVHGSKSQAETVFNASQSKELYNMVKSGSFVSQVADKAYAGLSTALNKIDNTTNNSSHVINIGDLVIKADNPQQFHDQFMHEIGKYWNVKLSESRVR